MIRSGKIVKGTLADFPSAVANKGALAQTLDTGKLYISDGASWNLQVSTAPSAPFDTTEQSPWYVQPATFDGNPLSDGTLGSISSTKDRILHYAGTPARLVLGGTSRVGGNIQWGTTSVLDGDFVGHAANTVYTATSSNIESSASAWLKFKDETDGRQTYAMRRITKHTDGRLRFIQYADDALVSSSPRVQCFSSQLQNKAGVYRIFVSPQFGDATTPWPTYVANKDFVLFFQAKGTATQPVIALIVSDDTGNADKLKVQVNLKTTNSGSIVTIATINNLAKNTRHNFVIEGTLDWTSAGYWKIYHENALVTTYNGNTLMSDLADQVQPMIGIYRYQYTAKAPDDCAVTFHLYGIKHSLT